MKKNNTTNINSRKKISFLSAIMFVVGSSIGAGIFLKNNEVLKNTHYSIIFSLIAWAIALFGILAMAFALIEIVSGSNSQNKEGIVGWVKTFNNKYLYVGARNFMAYVYLPINVFAMPYYAVQQFLDGIDIPLDWYWIATIAFVIMIYFIITTALSTKVANIQNWITLGAKVLPLLVAAFIGFVCVGLGDFKGNNWVSDINNHGTLMSNITPIVGIFMSIPSILFVVDGFYSSTAIQSDMRDPKKMPKALLAGLVIIFSLDIIIAISLMLGPNQGGGIGIFNGWLPNWVYKSLQILITIGILGIINGISVYAAKMYEQMFADNTLILSRYVKSKYGHDPIKVNMGYMIIINIIGFALATLIGCFFINTSMYDSYGVIGNKLYSFVDLTANWTALFAFLIIAIAIIGGLINRKTHRIKVSRKKTFIPFAIITISIMGISTLMATANAVGNVVITSIRFDGSTESIEELIGAILMLLVMFIFLLILFVSPKFTRKSNLGC